jgi:FANCL UBC-like domain 3
VLQQFRAALQPFLPLWEVLDDLDSHTWVLEPEVIFQLLKTLIYTMCYILRHHLSSALVTLQFMRHRLLIQAHEDYHALRYNLKLSVALCCIILYRNLDCALLQHRSRAVTQRRIALAPHCSLMLAVDATAPRAAPEVRFFGADTAVTPLRHRVKQLMPCMTDCNADSLLVVSSSAE